MSMFSFSVHLRHRLAVVVLAGALVSCSTPPPIETAAPPPAGEKAAVGPQEKYDYQHTVAAPKPPAERRPVVALLRAHDIVELADVLPFGRTRVVVVEEEGKPKRVEVQVPEDYPVQMPGDVRQFLTHELVNSKQVIVVERERILEILREQAFWQTRHVDQATTPKPGRLIGVHYILEAAFYPAGSKPAADSIWAEFDQLLLQRGRRSDLGTVAAVYVSAYDTETGMVAAVGYGAHANHALAVREAVRDLLEKLPPTTPPIRIVGFDDDGNAIVDIGTASGTGVGDRFIVPGAQGNNAELEVWQVDPLTCMARFLVGDRQAAPAGSVVQREPARAREAAESPEG